MLDNTVLSILDYCDLCTFESILFSHRSESLPNEFDPRCVELHDKLQQKSYAHNLRAGLCLAVALFVTMAARMQMWCHPLEQMW